MAGMLLELLIAVKSLKFMQFIDYYADLACTHVDADVGGLTLVGKCCCESSRDMQDIWLASLVAGLVHEKNAHCQKLLFFHYN